MTVGTHLTPSPPVGGLAFRAPCLLQQPRDQLHVALWVPGLRLPCSAGKPFSTPPSSVSEATGELRVKEPGKKEGKSAMFQIESPARRWVRATERSKDSERKQKVKNPKVASSLSRNFGLDLIEKSVAGT